MKAKVGNRVVNVIPDDGRFLDLSDMTYYDAADLSFDFDDDWQAFRREAAKDILCALVSRTALGEDIVMISVEYADKLITKLKED